jgi:hypothetical protein
MFVLGLILILLSAGALVAVLASGTDDTAALYGGSVTMPTLVAFLLGAGTLLVFVIGLELVRSGVKRANKNRRDKRRLRKLERREELRRDTAADGTATGATEPAAGDRVGRGDTGDTGEEGARHRDHTTGAGHADAATTPVPRDAGDHEPGTGPAQAPPPPSR